MSPSADRLNVLVHMSGAESSTPILHGGDNRLLYHDANSVPKPSTMIVGADGRRPENKTREHGSRGRRRDVALGPDALITTSSGIPGDRGPASPSRRRPSTP